MLIASQFRVNNNVNRIIGRAPFDLVLRFRPKMRMNIEITETENNYNILCLGNYRSALHDCVLSRKCKSDHIKAFIKGKEIDLNKRTY